MVNDSYSMIEMPCGTLLARVSEKGLKELTFISDDDIKKWNRLMVFQRPTMLQRMSLEATSAWITAYLDGGELKELKLDIDGTEFQNNVWMTSRETIIGESISYLKLAEKAGYDGAARAVGTAMGENPLSIIIPCHRVIRSDGKIGNYSGHGGNDTKSWLLEHEMKRTQMTP